MKKVLSIVLNPFTNDSRVLKECLSLQKDGFVIQVAALYEEGLAVNEEILGIKVHRLKLRTRKLSKHPLVQFFKYLEFVGRVVSRFRKIDIVHCNDLEALVIGVLIKILRGGKVKLVYDAHEFETEQKANPNPTIHCLMVWLEKTLIRHTDAVITVSNGIAREYARRYKINKPTLVMNCPEYREVRRYNKFRQNLGISPEKVIFLYQGGFIGGRGIELILEAFGCCRRDDVALVMMGFGPLDDKVQEAVEKYKNIYYHPAVSTDVLLTYTASADVGVMPYENICLNHYYCLPNKFFEYAMAGLPIMSNKLAEMEELISRYSCGVVFAEEKPESVLNAIDLLMDSDLPQLSKNSRQMALDYEWSKQEKALLDLYRGFNN